MSNFEQVSARGAIRFEKPTQENTRDTLSALQLHRARRDIDAEIERYENLLGTFAEQGLGDDTFARGVIHGLMKARIELFTTEESAESWRVRKEMFG